jgi:hypothetical protein
MVDVNMAIIRTKVIEKQMFKDKEPIKKFNADWKRSRDYNNLLSKPFKRCKQKTHQKI